jgi:hypothetical protein
VWLPTRPARPIIETDHVVSRRAIGEVDADRGILPLIDVALAP